MNSRKPVILYLTHDASMGSRAAMINTKHRKYAMEKAGGTVKVFAHRPGHFFRDCILLLHLLPAVTYLTIRIDGSGTLDKFTFLKFFRWNIRIVWEVHGFPEENYDINYPEPSWLRRVKFFLRRYLLSFLVYDSIFISHELRRYARGKMITRRSVVIPNFIPPNSDKLTHITSSPVVNLFKNSHCFIVLWGGFGQLRWQALDIIEAAARKIYRIDPSVIFLLVCSDSWHRFRWRKNILILHSCPRSEFLEFVRCADVCLALYHKPVRVPFYFTPLKIIDYMILQKPIIATRQKTIRSMITDHVNGLLTNNTVDDVVEKLLILKNNPALAARLGRNAGQTIRAAYTDNGILAKYRTVFASQSQ